MNLDISTFEDWLLVGDFNLYRSVEDRNKPGGDIGYMQMFNDLTSNLELVDLPSVAGHTPGAICNSTPF